eukprot:Skav219291  [mRNA]  locus=scaffold2157:222105:233438:- [translate_table: standard]
MLPLALPTTLPDQKGIADVLEQILCNVPLLAKDAYGNYVVQHMLEHGRKEDKQRIIQTIRANIADFSREKYSSNVVEKCFEIATTGEHADTDIIQQERTALLGTVLEVPDVLFTLCTNTYGNYVVQRILENARGEMELQSLYQAIKNVEQQILSRDVPPGMKEDTASRDGDKQDPREVFKHIQNYLAKAAWGRVSACRLQSTLRDEACRVNRSVKWLIENGETQLQTALVGFELGCLPSRKVPGCDGENTKCCASSWVFAAGFLFHLVTWHQLQELWACWLRAYADKIDDAAKMLSEKSYPFQQEIDGTSNVDAKIPAPKSLTAMQAIDKILVMRAATDSETLKEGAPPTAFSFLSGYRALSIRYLSPIASPGIA